MHRHNIFLDYVELLDNCLDISGCLISYCKNDAITVYATVESNGSKKTFTGNLVEYPATYRKTYYCLDVPWRFYYNFEFKIPIDAKENYKVYFKIKYEENIEVFKENTEKNFKKFVEKLGNCELSYLEDGIIFIDINSFGDLDDLEDHIEKGFEFVSKEFLEKLEFEIDDKSPKVKFIKDLKNIIIIFNDESKLFIVPNGKEVQYHAIPAPVKSSKKNPPRRSNSILISNRNRRNL